MTWRQLILAVGIGAILLVHSSDAPACGPYPRETVFSYTSYPVLNADRYAAGELGVIQPTYWRRFLLVAYRYLSETPLSAQEQAIFSGVSGPSDAPEGEGEQNWRDTRSRVPGLDPLPLRIARDRRIPGSDWQRVMNCNDAGFATAAETLARRIDEFGADSNGVRRWVTAQDQVFSNCSDGATIPANPETELPPILAADRRYQVAAARFYAFELAEAEREFAAIASDNSSPWSDIATYMVARCLLRRATLDPRDGYVDLAVASSAVAQLEGILDDPARVAVHSSAQRLLEHALAKTRPGDRLVTIARALSTPGDEGFRQKLVDYELLMDRNFTTKPSVRAESDLIDWVMTFQAGEFDHALERWQSSHSTPWLVAAIAHVPPDHPFAAELRTAASLYAPNSPAWPTLTYHRVQHLVALGQQNAARDELDSALSLPVVRAQESVRNLFLEQRFALARDLDEAIRFAPRHPVAEGMGLGEALAGSPPDDAPELLFARDSVRILNQGLPLDMLARASRHEGLPSHLRAQLTLVTWVRAVLLERWDAALRLIEALRAHFPSLAQDLDQWMGADTDDERRFASTYLLLRHPRMKPHLVSGLAMKTNLEGIDNLRDNWWCGLSSGADLDAEGFWRLNAASARAGSPPAITPPDFLTESERGRLSTEWAALQQLETAPNYLAAIATDYARDHLNDPRSPEALFLAVRATRYGCTDGGTGARSRTAFRLLHRSWPDSEWTRRTPYWFR